MEIRIYIIMTVLRTFAADFCKAAAPACASGARKHG
jgi:hypothetical protein